jgi:hypothetical protein
VLFFVSQSQPFLLPLSRSNMNPLVSSHVPARPQAPQLAEQASLIEGSSQYMDLRFAELFVFLFSQAQFTVSSEFVVTN